jgi:hypothetical protein
MKEATEPDAKQKQQKGGASNHSPLEESELWMRHLSANSRPRKSEDSNIEAERLRVEAQRTLDSVSYELANLSQKWKITEEPPTIVKESVHQRNHCLKQTQRVDSRKSCSSSSSRVVEPSTPKISREHQAVPYMYKAALTHEWDDVVSRTVTYPMEATYIHSDGSTVLHLAVISRAIYANCKSIDGQLIRDIWNFDCNKVPASIDVIRALLNANPEALKVRCKVLGYPPLAYALLVPPNNDFETESVVRLLIDPRSDGVLVPTTTGMSPLEVHIQSYSQVHGTLKFSTRSEAESIKTTSMLRILLEADLHSDREYQQGKTDDTSYISKSRLLEILYEWNSSAVLDALECASISSGRNNSLSNADLNGWWVWQWMLIILKYSVAGTWTQGSEFSATHAAAGLENGCPMPFLMLLGRAFPNQVRIPCPITGTNRYVLHSICCWGGKEPRNDDSVNYSRKQMAMSVILREHPAAASMTDADGRTPLCLAVENRTLWNGGVSKLYRAFPGALHICNPQTGLYPFMTSAAAAPQKDGETCDKSSLLKTGDMSNGTCKELQQLWTIYKLLRAAPEVLVDCLDNNDDNNSWLEFRRAAEQQSLAQILQHWSITSSDIK